MKSFKHVNICLFFATVILFSDHGQLKEYAITYWTDLDTQWAFLVDEDR